MFVNRKLLTEKIKTKAHELGFSLAGITTCDPPEYMDVYHAWLDAGFHGTMAWMASERALSRRADLHKILPECKSVLVLGMPYACRCDSEPREAYGRVASYAWGKDYHDVIPPLLQSLVDYIEAETGSPVPNRWYTDSGPLPERELAQRAGLGWVGKNSCLINPRTGSFFFLAEILLGIPLEPDPPFQTDHCGTCTRCIDACPSSCILPNKSIDSTRCISYLTIELKTAIPDDLRSVIGDWVFGCDVCQQVCPWNRHAGSGEVKTVFKTMDTLPYLHLAETLALSAEEFNRKFKGTPLKRPKRRGVLRNVVVVMGNQKLPAFLEPLKKALHDDEPLVRSHAAWALGEIGGTEASIALEESLKTELDESVRRAVRNALESM